MATTFVKGSAIFCGRPDFQKFLSEQLKRDISDSKAAADGLREICGIESRRELATNPEARRKYMDLVWEFNHNRYQGGRR